MKTMHFVCGIAAMAMAFPAAADSILRIKCYDNDVDAEIFINGHSKGACPLDVSVAAGTVKLRAQKINGDYGQFFDTQIVVVEGVPQRVDVTLSAPRLTTEGKLRQEAAEAAAQLRAAESGDIEAMKKVVSYYSTGTGLAKDPAQARAWQKKMTAAVEAKQRKEAYEENIKASNGDVAAMESLVKRYETGTGVEIDAAQAQAW
ncbi:MAG TPA: hypothetical protein VFM34_08880, partial [Moraxellaceae bacterium]|nr:hypothetical protein [Moraxellaceae bacterium]